MEELSEYLSTGDDNEFEVIQQKAILLQVLEQQLGDPLWRSCNEEATKRANFLMFHIRKEMIDNVSLNDYYQKIRDFYVDRYNSRRNGNSVEIQASEGSQMPLDFNSLILHTKLIELMLKDAGLNLREPEKYSKYKFLLQQMKEDIRENPGLVELQDQLYEFYIDKQRSEKTDVTRANP